MESEVVLIRPKSRKCAGAVGEKNIAVMSPFSNVRNASPNTFQVTRAAYVMLRWLIADFGFRLESELVLIRPKRRNRSGAAGEKNIAVMAPFSNVRKASPRIVVVNGTLFLAGSGRREVRGKLFARA